MTLNIPNQTLIFSSLYFGFQNNTTWLGQMSQFVEIFAWTCSAIISMLVNFKFMHFSISPFGFDIVFVYWLCAQVRIPGHEHFDLAANYFGKKKVYNPFIRKKVLYLRLENIRTHLRTPPSHSSLTHNTIMSFFALKIFFCVPQNGVFDRLELIIDRKFGFSAKFYPRIHIQLLILRWLEKSRKFRSTNL